MPSKIPVKTAKEVADKHNCKQVIIMAWDGKLTHCVTYGKTVEDCDQAARGGNKIKAALGWPESLMSEPSRIKKLKEQIKKLEVELKEKTDIIDRAKRMAQAIDAQNDEFAARIERSKRQINEDRFPQDRNTY